MPILVATWSKKRVRGCSFVGTAGSNPAGAWESVYCACCVLSGRGPCDRAITHPAESYLVKYV
jgi:hypothetical protein